MQRSLPTRTAIAVLAVALLVPLALSVASAAEDDAEGDTTVRPPSEAEPPRNHSLEIRLVGNATGEPAADVPVKVMNRWTPGEDRRGSTDSWDRRTGEDGAVRLNASEGPVRVAVDHPDWQRLRASFRLEGNLSLELTLRPASEDLARLSGTVRSADDGALPNATVEVDPARECEREPCAVQRESRGAATETTVNGTEVHLRWRPHDGHAYVDAGEDGSYEVAVPPGSYRLEAEAPDHLRSERPVEVGANETAEADLELTPIPPDSVTLRGVIRDASTGEPVPGVAVTVESPRWGSHDRARADANGTYQVTTKPGHLVVEADADARRICVADEPREAHGSAGGGAGTAVVAPEPHCEARDGPDQRYLPRSLGLQAEDGATRNVSLALPPQPDHSARIQGWVLDDASGGPVPNATVHLRNEETGEWGRAPVDENGSFTADVPAGYHTVRVRAPGHLQNATNVAVDEGGTAEVVLRTPAGEPARERGCCYAAETAASGHGDASHGGDAEASGASLAGGPGSPSGEATIQGEPGGLGPYDPSSSGDDGPTRNGAPAPGGAALVAALSGAAALGRRRRGG